MKNFIKYGGLNYVLAIIFVFVVCFYACGDIDLKDVANIAYYIGLACFNLITGGIFTIYNELQKK